MLLASAEVDFHSNFLCSSMRRLGSSLAEASCLKSHRLFCFRNCHCHCCCVVPWTDAFRANAIRLIGHLGIPMQQSGSNILFSRSHLGHDGQFEPPCPESYRHTPRIQRNVSCSLFCRFLQSCTVRCLYKPSRRQRHLAFQRFKICSRTALTSKGSQTPSSGNPDSICRPGCHLWITSNHCNDKVFDAIDSAS